MPRSVCQAAVGLVGDAEGFYPVAYFCPAGVPTIGFGHTKGVAAADVGHKTITRAEADDLLRQDLAEAAAAVERLVTVNLSNEQFGALVSFTFNLGSGNLAKSTLLKKLNAGDYMGAANEFGVWVKATVGGVKKTLPGLVKRRKAEMTLFIQGTNPDGNQGG